MTSTCAGLVVLLATIGCSGVDPVAETNGGHDDGGDAPPTVPPSDDVLPAETDDDATTSDTHAGVDAGPSYPVPPALHVVATEQATGKVIVFDFAVTDWAATKAVVWSWTPPAKAIYANLSDARYSRDGKRLLVAASTGAIAVVDVATKKLLFEAAPGGNPHALEELPDGNLVSAGSGGELKVWSKKGTVLQTVALADAHGVVWDVTRKRLWADGASVVRSFTYASGKLTSAGSWAFPDGESGAHDLFAEPGTSRMFVTSSRSIWTFDRDTLTFAPYDAGPDRSAIKAIGRNPGSPVVCMTKATNAPGPKPRSWSTDTVIFDQPGGSPATVTRVRKGAQFYKARWAAPSP